MQREFENTSYKFQFHKGTIKTLREQIKKVSEQDFNSIKVRLKRPAPRLALLGTLFQFHKGTIKTYQKKVS